jgi:hypothetical protein
VYVCVVSCSGFTVFQYIVVIEKYSLYQTYSGRNTKLNLCCDHNFEADFRDYIVYTKILLGEKWDDLHRYLFNTNCKYIACLDYAHVETRYILSL